MRKGGYTGMRCKLHPLVPGSVGVCAYCLRERLLDLLAAQARDAGSGDDRRKSDPSPPPLIFPRSVSPYTNRRSVHDQHHLLFYSTPQVGSTFSGDGNVKKKHGRFSLFRSLFRSSTRSGEMDGDLRVFGARNESSPSNSTPSWFSTLLPRSRKKKSRLFSLDDEFSGAGCRRSCPAVDRGMSPSAERKGYGDGDESPIGSEYSSESSTGRRKPATPAHRKQGGGAQHSRNVSGFAFCLSPLVSHRHRPESGPSGEFRGANRHHLSSAASLSSNRSRKLVDFGRKAMLSWDYQLLTTEIFGVLKNGNTVAVKKLMIGESRMAKANFESEVKLISNVHHRNLIRLLGCCNKGPELMLVYEYMANSSLDKFLFGDKRGILNWKHRFDIIVGTARGLAYLHNEFHVRIIHRDIKSSNILLDDDFQPKIADFGLARLLPEDQSHLSTKFAGTLGYTAPEYAIHGQLSEKVDTYSYGVVVLEIVSGRKSNDVKLEPVTQYLLEWAWKLYESNELMKLVDERLDPSEYQTEQVKRVMEIALMCTQSSAASRPSMSEIVVLLLSKGEAELKPTRPTFIEATKRVQTDTSTSTASSASNATVSISQFSAR